MRNCFEFSIDDRTGQVKLTRAVDLVPYLSSIKKQRQALGKGFSKSRNLRKIASIPIHVLIEHGIDINDDKAIRKFLREHPEFRCSEGEI